MIAYLMHYEKKLSQDALTAVNRERRCAYPNIGFQLQLQFFEKSGSFDCSGFNIFAEIVMTIQRKLNDLSALIESIMEGQTGRKTHAIIYLSSIHLQNGFLSV